MLVVGGSIVGLTAALACQRLYLELMFEAAEREATLLRYRIPTEAVYRAIEEEWRSPARRGELESALTTLDSALRARLLG